LHSAPEDSDNENDTDSGSEDNEHANGGFDEDNERAYAEQDDCDADSDPGPMHIDDDNGRPRSPQAGQKRPRRDSDLTQPDINEFRDAIKVKNSKGKPKADDWETDVQEILAKAILSYETRLATQGLFPDHMEEVTWAKVAWLDGCHDCGLKIHHNSELIKIVSLSLYHYPILIEYVRVSSRVVELIFVVS
jgi:hypothetical protein